MTGSIGIETEINGLVCGIGIPMYRSIDNTRIWIEVVDKRCPHARHHRTEVNVRLRYPIKRFAVVVSQSSNVVEYKCDLLKMSHTWKEWHICRVHVEPVAVCWGWCLGPGFALSPAIRMHQLVTCEGWGAAPLLAVWWHALVSEICWNALRWVVGVELEDALGYRGGCLEVQSAVWMG